jgi:Putative amidase domain/Concanavalin A-like lectin/glucanases superfamily
MRFVKLAPLRADLLGRAVAPQTRGDLMRPSAGARARLLGATIVIPASCSSSEGTRHVQIRRTLVILMIAVVAMLILPSLAFASSYSDAVLANSPTGYWRLGDTSGPTAVDSSPNHYNGTYSSGVTLGVAGALNTDPDTAANVSEFSDGISASGSGLSFGTGNFSFEGWVRTPSPAGSTGYVLASDSSWTQLFCDSTNSESFMGGWQVTINGWKPGEVGHVEVDVQNAPVPTQTNCENPPNYLAAFSDVAIDDGSWHHVVVSVDRSTGITIYVDGEAAFTAGDTSSTSLASGLGVSFGSGGEDMDELALYRAALSASDVVAHYDAARPWGDSTSDPSSDPADPTPGTAVPDEVTTDSDPGVLDPPGGAVIVNRTAVKNYALQYVGTNLGTDSSAGWNNAQYPGPPTNDCQDFVSQALRVGGWPDDTPAGSDPLTGTNVWWYSDSADHSFSWTAVTYFWRYAQQSGRGVYVRYWSDLQPGDIVMVDWYGTKGYPTHSMIVTATATTNSGIHQVYLTYHTRDRKNMPITTLRTEFPHAHWWAFHIYDQF